LVKLSKKQINSKGCKTKGGHLRLVMFLLKMIFFKDNLILMAENRPDIIWINLLGENDA
jgi:hypothetical protein